MKAVEGLDAHVLAFDIQGGVNGETAEEIYVIFNANDTEAKVTLPEGEWNIYVQGDKAGTEVLGSISDGNVSVGAISAMVLVREGNAVSAALSGGSLPTPVLVVIIVLAVLALGVVIFVVARFARRR